MNKKDWARFFPISKASTVKTKASFAECQSRANLAHVVGMLKFHTEKEGMNTSKRMCSKEKEKTKKTKQNKTRKKEKEKEE